jgi:hypothetical protein
METEILNITQTAFFEDKIINREYHVHEPYNLNFDYGNQIDILIHHQDINTLPCDSYLNIEGEITFTKIDATADAFLELTNGYALHLFENMSFYINNELLENVRKPGITTLIKTVLTHSKSQAYYLENAGFDPELKLKKITATDTKFNVVLPLRLIFSFCADYERILPYCKQELKLLRAQNDNNLFVATNAKNSKFVIKNISWCVPYVSVDNKEKIKLLKLLERDAKIELPFRYWDIYEHPNLTSSTETYWNIKTSSTLERPRYVIIFFSTNRKNTDKSDFGHFDDLSTNSVTLYLNSQNYPYEPIKTDFANNKYAKVFNNCIQFVKSYNGKELQPMLDLYLFKNKFPLFVISCNEQNETVKTGSIDIKLKLEFAKNVPSNTTCFALIISDKIVEYKLASKTVYHRV